MIWFNTGIYFLLWSFGLWVGFIVYGLVLLHASKYNKTMKNTIALIVYLTFACFLFSPLAIALTYNVDWLIKFNNNNLYMIYVIVLYLSSAVPGGRYFKLKYLDRLKSRVFFKE